VIAARIEEQPITAVAGAHPNPLQIGRSQERDRRSNEASRNAAQGWIVVPSEGDTVAPMEQSRMPLRLKPGRVEVLQISSPQTPSACRRGEQPKERFAQSDRPAKFARCRCRMRRGEAQNRIELIGWEHPGVAAPQHQIAEIMQVLMAPKPFVAVECVHEIQRYVAGNKPVPF
jgi:hypothetical protein